MRKQKGFSLIELLIVVAIILIIAAIAIPNLLRSRIAANETAAVGSIRAINTAEVGYASTYPDAGYADTLAKLGPAAGGTVSSDAAGLLDNVLGCASEPCKKAGYDFTLGTSATVGYVTNGAPTTPNTTGVKYFYSDASGVIRSDGSAAATVASTPIQ